MAAIETDLPLTLAVDLLCGVNSDITAETLQSQTIAWRSDAPLGVDLSCTQFGFLVLNFERAESYTGGAVPPITDGRISSKVETAQKNRQEIMARRLRYANALLTCLTSARHEVDKFAAAPFPILEFSQWLKAKSSESGNWKIILPESYEYRGRSGLQLSPSALDHSAKLLAAAHSVFGDMAFTRLELLGTANSQYQRHQYASAHVLAWAIAESVISHMWDQAIDMASTANGGHTHIDKKRREKLIGRDYSASVQTEILSFLKVLPEGLRVDLDRVRKKRNDFAHSLEDVSGSEAYAALRLAADVISHLVGQKLFVSSGLSFQTSL